MRIKVLDAKYGQAEPVWTLTEMAITLDLPVEVVKEGVRIGILRHTALDPHFRMLFGIREWLGNQITAQNLREYGWSLTLFALLDEKMEMWYAVDIGGQVLSPWTRDFEQQRAALAQMAELLAKYTESTATFHGTEDQDPEWRIAANPEWKN